MRALRFLPLLAVLLVMPISSCSDDDSNPVKPKAGYKTLDADGPRDNVLNNLQFAYNDRNISRYDELLDQDFIFYFSEYDFQNGLVTVEYWSRAAEINANKNIFDPNYSNPTQEPVQDIDISAKGEYLTLLTSYSIETFDLRGNRSSPYRQRAMPPTQGHIPCDRTYRIRQDDHLGYDDQLY